MAHLENPALKEIPAGSSIDAQPPASHWRSCRRYNTKSSNSCADKVPPQGGMRLDVCTASPPSAIAIENSTGQVRGPREHDARVAALCIGNGVRELLTADRDFDRFPELASRNPLIIAE
jgi:hypothetical protein